MSLLTTRLGLKKPQDSDPFLTTDFDTNYDIIDTYPGVFICTSTTLPSWTTAQAGQEAYCTDTFTILKWTGTAWRDPLVLPGLWSVSATYNTSIFPAASPTFTIGSVSSSRACSAMATLMVNLKPLPLALPYSITASLLVNGTTTGPKIQIAQDGSVPYSDAGVWSTAQNTRNDSDMIHLNAGSNTLAVSVAYNPVPNYQTDSSHPSLVPAIATFIYGAKCTLVAGSGGPN